MLKPFTMLRALSFAVAARAASPEPLVTKFETCLTRDQAMLSGARLAQRDSGVLFDIDKNKATDFVKVWNAKFHAEVVAEEAFAVIVPSAPRVVVLFVHDGKSCEIDGVTPPDMKALLDAIPNPRDPPASPRPSQTPKPIEPIKPIDTRPEGDQSL